ncbi:MAG TPA: HD domain-containing phosphohydrolase [Patescibacteria group bacterium]|nr:HD domain-containing phosphohydrolase [Patescibacteria group bacterium]
MDPQFPRPADDRRDLDRMTIRYLDGITTASPVRAPAGSGLAAVPDDGAGIPTGQLLAALSTALDLTEGQLPGHSLRTCFLALRVADSLDLAAPDRRDLFHAAFLKDAGCSSNAAAVTRIFGGEDQVLKRRQATIGRSLLAQADFAIRNLPPGEALPLRLRRLVRIGLSGKREQRQVEQIRCERGASIARKAGFSERAGRAVHDVHEHWDGGGQPRGLRGDAIEPLARIIAACQGLDVFLSTRGRSEALRVVAGRSGTWYDPDVSATLLDLASRGLLDDLAAPDLIGRTLDLEPDGIVEIADGAAIDRIAEAFADIVDAKSPFTGTHSRLVAEVAERLAVSLGLEPSEIVDVRRAGLLHDLGKLGVPNSILDKPARLEPEEFAIIQRHPELTLRILAPIPTFATVAELAACHHERLDGRGYFRGLAAPALAIGARIVTVADVWEALTADRPYRAAMDHEQAMAVIQAETGDHLALEVVGALDDLVRNEPAPDRPAPLSNDGRVVTSAA